MSGRLHVDYRATVGWAGPIRAAIQAKASLARKDRRWRRGELSDLAFAIETRLMCLPEIIRWIDENLATVGRELPDRVTAVCLSQPDDPLAFTVRDRRALRRVLIGAGAFITESRACFETLARFYRLFLREYLGEAISVPASYEAVKRVSRPYGWVRRLQQIRNSLLHERAFWIEFDADHHRQPPYELVLLLNWRPEAVEPRSRVPMRALREIRDGLGRAARALQRRLIRRVGAVES